MVDLLSKGLDSVKGRLRSLSSASKETRQAFDQMAKSMKYAAGAGLATREIYKGLKPAVGLAGDLQSEMIGVKAELMGAGKDAKTLNSELKAIKSSAFAIQAWTPFDMTQIVALEKELVKAGAAVQDVVGEKGAAAAAAALAVYEKMDPTQTGKALIGIGTPFKIAADGYMDLADTVSRASSASTTGAAEIVETAKYAALNMALLGKSSKEMLTFSAVMAQVGIEGSMAGVSIKEFFGQAAKQRGFKDAKGNLKATVDIIKILREQMKGMGSGDQLTKLEKIFGERGGKVAMGLLNEGKGSYEDIAKAIDAGISLQEKLNLSMGAFNNQLTALQGTFKSTIADLFQPALIPLTALLKKTNDFITAIGTLSQKGDAAGKAVSGISLGALGAGTLATLALGGASLYYGKKVLKGAGGIKGLLKGFGGTAAGIAEGKAVQAATGVTPVFVTNWPVNFGGGPGGGILPELVKGGKGGFVARMLSKVGALPSLPGTAGMLGRLAGVGRIGATLAGGVGAAGAGMTAALVGGTALAAYGLGTGINHLIDKAFGEKGGLGAWLYDVFNPSETKGNKTEVNLSLNIDEKRRMTSTSDDMNTSVKLNRGNIIMASSH